MTLTDQIEAVRKNLAKGAYQNEAAISVGVVLPVLRLLGWDIADPIQIVPEFTIDGGRVDFALFAEAQQPSVLIEVKAVNRLASGDRQLFEYAFHSGVSVCVLTDGRSWNFYYPPGEGNYANRCVCSLDLSKSSPSDAIEYLTRYLNRERVVSGAARDAMDRDFRLERGRRKVTKALPSAWRNLVSSADSPLVSLLQGKVEADIGLRPSTGAVADFLQSMSVATPPIVESRAAGEHPASTAARPITKHSVPAAPNSMMHSPRAVKFTIFGDERIANNATSALIAILGELAARFPEKISDMAAHNIQRSRSQIARTPHEASPSRPEQAREFYDGWMIGTNIKNTTKEQIIRHCCDVVGVRFGSDVVIRLPDGSWMAA